MCAVLIGAHPEASGLVLTLTSGLASLFELFCVIAIFVMNTNLQKEPSCFQTTERRRMGWKTE